MNDVDDESKHEFRFKVDDRKVYVEPSCKNTGSKKLERFIKKAVCNKNVAGNINQLSSVIFRKIILLKERQNQTDEHFMKLK